MPDASPGAAWDLAHDRDSAIGDEAAKFVAGRNASFVALPRREGYLSLGADFGHDPLQ